MPVLSQERGVVSVLDQRLLDSIRAGGFAFELLKNERRIRSSEEGAAYWKIHIGQTAPAQILRAGSRFLLLVISGIIAKVDLETLAGCIEVAALRMATSQEIEARFGLRPGDVPLVGLDQARQKFTGFIQFPRLDECQRLLICFFLGGHVLSVAYARKWGKIIQV